MANYVRSMLAIALSGSLSVALSGCFDEFATIDPPDAPPPNYGSVLNENNGADVQTVTGDLERAPDVQPVSGDLGQVPPAAPKTSTQADAGAGAGSGYHSLIPEPLHTYGMTVQMPTPTVGPFQSDRNAVESAYSWGGPYNNIWMYMGGAGAGGGSF